MSQLIRGSSILLLLSVLLIHPELGQSGRLTLTPAFGHTGSGGLGDYRLKNGDPFVTFYEHENFRGKLFRQGVRKDCANIPNEYENWASSVILHSRCITLCDSRNCEGNCKNLYPDPDKDKKGFRRLKDMNLNDKASSLKFCYQYG